VSEEEEGKKSDEEDGVERVEDDAEEARDSGSSEGGESKPSDEPVEDRGEVKADDSKSVEPEGEGRVGGSQSDEPEGDRSKSDEPGPRAAEGSKSDEPGGSDDSESGRESKSDEDGGDLLLEEEVSDEEVARILEDTDLGDLELETPLAPDPEVEKLLAPEPLLPSEDPVVDLLAESADIDLPARPSDGLEMFEPSAEPHTGPERRRGERKISKLNKLLTGQVDLGEGDQMVYLYLVDLSEGGMRVNVDQNFPEGQTFRMKLGLESFGSELGQGGVLDLPLQVVWQKRLVGGMTVAGLKFVEPTEEAREAVKQIMELFSVEGKRRRFRLNRVLGVGIGLDENTRWLYPLALDLSVGGMRIRTEENLVVGDELTLKIFLQFDLPVVNVNAKVVWKEEVQANRFQIGLEFQNVTEDVARPVQEYIDRCLAEEMGKAGTLK
jgi:c-di-GMP-binding flagellar brake protein YcgR